MPADTTDSRLANPQPLLSDSHPRLAQLRRVAIWCFCWLLLKAAARQPCVAFLLQYWALRSPRNAIHAPSRVKTPMEALLLVFL